MNYKLLLLFCSIFLYASRGIAQDRVFTYTYQSGTLNKGQREIEVWNTLHSGRSNYYRSIKSRIEFEMGITQKIQTSFYLNFESASMEKYSPGEVPLHSITSTQQLGFSNEWKMQFTNPSADLFGSALYAEIEVSPSEAGIETKLILDKQFDQIYHSLNLNIEPEWETEIENNEIEHEFELEFGLNYGLTWNVNKHWNTGFELMNINKYNPVEHLEYSAVFIGPAISYSSDNIWINFTLLPQLPSFYNKNKEEGKRLIFDGHEKLEARILLSFNL